MGMYYIIQNDKDYEGGSFPKVLSYFFEQVGGYGDKSIVNQIEKILDIDLSIFQKTYHPGMEDYLAEEESFNINDYWLDINIIITKIEEFIAKMKSAVGFFNQVILNHKNVKLDISEFTNETAYMKFLKENPIILFPTPEIVDERSLFNSSLELASLLHDFKRNGVEKIRLIYM